MDQPVREFCLTMRPRLVGTLTLMYGDQHLAEELAQETLARVWNHWRRLEKLESDVAAAWAYRVAINLSRSWWRRRIAERRAVERAGSNVGQAHRDPDAADAVAVRQALARLPVRQRTALALRYYADLPVADVAELMGCATGTVKALTSQAMAAMRRQLELTEEAHDGS